MIAVRPRPVSQAVSKPGGYHSIAPSAPVRASKAWRTSRITGTTFSPANIITAMRLLAISNSSDAVSPGQRGHRDTTPQPTYEERQLSEIDEDQRTGRAAQPGEIWASAQRS